MLPAQSWDMIRARQRRATLQKEGNNSIDKREKVYQEFGTFMAGFVRDLNNSSEEGWSLLVEGLRDERALRRLGFRGTILTVAQLGRSGTSALGSEKSVVILTDLDREGTVLASRFVRKLTRDGVRTSLGERRRLKTASRGVFLHVENLGRFASPETTPWEPAVPLTKPTQSRAYREGLQRFRRRRAAV